MGKKGKWLSAVKNVFRSSSKDSAQVKENLTPVSKEKNESESEEVWVMLFMSVQMYGFMHTFMYVHYVCRCRFIARWKIVSVYLCK